jgi:biopolymer transport protein ExbD
MRLLLLLALTACTRTVVVSNCADASASDPPTAVPLDLPRAAGSEASVIFDVILAADGSANVQGHAVANDDAILPAAREAQAKNPELRAVIKADSQVPHGRVINVLDLLKQAGVSKIAFGVTPIPPHGGIQ